MHDLNDALDELRHVIPYAHSPSVRKLSKIATLLLAKNYILMQTNALNELRRILICIQQQQQSGGAAIPQALSASVTSLLGSSAALIQTGSPSGSVNYKSGSWTQGGACIAPNPTSIGSNGSLAQSLGKSTSTNSSGVGEEQQATSVQNRRRKYNVLINRILGDVANHHLLNPITCFQTQNVQPQQAQTQHRQQQSGCSLNGVNNANPSQSLGKLAREAAGQVGSTAMSCMKPIDFCTQNKSTYPQQGSFITDQNYELKAQLKRKSREHLVENEVTEDAVKVSMGKKASKQMRCAPSRLLDAADESSSSMSSSQSSTSCISLVSVGSPVRQACRVVVNDIGETNTDEEQHHNMATATTIGRGSIRSRRRRRRRSQSASTIVSELNEEEDEIETGGIIFDAGTDMVAETEMGTLHDSAELAKQEQQLDR